MRILAICAAALVLALVLAATVHSVECGPGQHGPRIASRIVIMGCP